MEIKVLWADTQAIVWRMFSLSRMLLHLLPFPSFTACSQVFEDVSFGASSRWLSSASIKTEKNLILRKKKIKNNTFFFLTPDFFWLILLPEAWCASLTTEKNQKGRDVPLIFLNATGGAYFLLTPNQGERRQKEGGNRQKRIEPNCDVPIYHVIYKMKWVKMIFKRHSSQEMVTTVQM